MPVNPVLRAASAHDSDAIATLHADSWRRHYRGAYLDSFLDGDVVSDRRHVWADRFARPAVRQFTIVADLDGTVVGFVHVILDHDPRWGALVDNLHVTSDIKYRGIGTRLLTESAAELTRRAATGGMYLWVLDINRPAQAFYAARGGIRVETEVRGPFPGGGTALAHRMAWPDPAHLTVRIRQNRAL